MYILHLSILAIFLLASLICTGIKLPPDLKHDDLWQIPFHKQALGLYGLLNTYTPGLFKKGTLKKSLMMLNPGADAGKLYKSYQVRRLSRVLMLIFGGNLLALMICLSSMSKDPFNTENTILRNGYGGGTKSVNLDILSDGEPVITGESISIGERQYSPEEVSSMMEEINTVLETAVLDKNKSLEYVCYDLNLMTSLKGYPVTIEWELSDYSVMTGSGHLRPEGILSEGIPLTLTATLSYYSFQADHSFNAMVYPPPVDDEESLTQQIRDSIIEYDHQGAASEYITLPTEINGHSITYRAHKTNDSLLLLALSALIGAALFKLGENDLEKELKKRDAQMMTDYPQIVSKLVLLLGAGMTIKGAFTKIAKDYERVLQKGKERFAYEEMLLCVREMESGVSEADAYLRFSSRCRLQKYVKLGALLSQNLKRGASGLLEALSEEERDAFEERKSTARRLGEEAGTKLLAPMGIMLIIVIVIVVIPAFLTFR